MTKGNHSGRKSRPPAAPATGPSPQEMAEMEVDWDEVERQVRRLSFAGEEGARLKAAPEEILAQAQRLAELYRRAGKPLPDALAALV